MNTNENIKYVSSIKMQIPSLSLFFAKSNSGKSHLMTYLLYNLIRRDCINWVIVITCTSFNNHWASIVGKEHVYDKFNEEDLINLLKMQGNLISSGKSKQGLIIFDDVLGDAKFNAEIFNKIASSGRHYNLSFFISSQHYKKIPPILRGNATYSFFLNQINDLMSRNLHEEYYTAKFVNWRVIQQYANKVCENYGALCVQNTAAEVEYIPIRAPSRLPIYTIIHKKKRTRKVR